MSLNENAVLNSSIMRDMVQEWQRLGDFEAIEDARRGVGLACEPCGDMKSQLRSQLTTGQVVCGVCNLKAAIAAIA